VEVVVARLLVHLVVLAVVDTLGKMVQVEQPVKVMAVEMGVLLLALMQEGVVVELPVPVLPACLDQEAEVEETP
jgi:hypothetical protein